MVSNGMDALQQEILEHSNARMQLGKILVSPETPDEVGDIKGRVM
jgi:hypothetical protein